MIDEKIMRKLLEHDEKFERIEERIGKTITSEEYADGYDAMMTILKRLDQERIFSTEWVRRIESKVETKGKELEEQKSDIRKMKLHLKIA